VVSSLSGSSVNLLPALQSLAQSPSTGAVSGLASDPDRDGDVHGVGGASNDTAKISRQGQILSQLQQLQTQNPTNFKQVVSEIATQLQTAAQQQGQTAQGQFLAQLASKFQSIARGGSLAQLQGAHHGHHAHQTYTQTGQIAPPSSALSSQNNGNATTSNQSIEQLFASISQEISQALAS
jgi:hypothetical protein